MTAFYERSEHILRPPFEGAGVQTRHSERSEESQRCFTFVQHDERRGVQTRLSWNATQGIPYGSLFSVLSKLRSVFTSYLAYSSKANSFRIVQKALSPHKWIDKIFKISGTKAAFSEEITQEQEKMVFGFY